MATRQAAILVFPRKNVSRKLVSFFDENFLTIAIFDDVYLVMILHDEHVSRASIERNVRLAEEFELASCRIEPVDPIGEELVARRQRIRLAQLLR